MRLLTPLAHTFHTLCSKSMTELLPLPSLAAKKKSIETCAIWSQCFPCRYKSDSSLTFVISHGDDNFGVEKH